VDAVEVEVEAKALRVKGVEVVAWMILDRVRDCMAR
jgi:hypothetical protein